MFGGTCVLATNIPLQEEEQQGSQHFFRSSHILLQKIYIILRMKFVY
jgi:hypothetical protein